MPLEARVVERQIERIRTDKYTYEQLKEMLINRLEASVSNDRLREMFPFGHLPGR